MTLVYYNNDDDKTAVEMLAELAAVAEIVEIDNYWMVVAVDFVTMSLCNEIVVGFPFREFLKLVRSVS